VSALSARKRNDEVWEEGDETHLACVVTFH
jgi:hypothetical protein